MPCRSEGKLSGGNAQDERSCLSLPQYLPEDTTGEDLIGSFKASSSGDSTEAEKVVKFAQFHPNVSCDSKTANSEGWKVKGLIAASGRDTSPYSNASGVKPRLIPFDDGSHDSAAMTPAMKTNGVTPLSSKPTLKRSHVHGNQREENESDF